MNRVFPDGSNPIGQRLKLEMAKRGVSSTDLARRADVKTSFLYDIISGKSTNPSPVKLARVAESLNVSLGYLVGSDSDAPPAALLDDDYLVVPHLTVDMSGSAGKVVATVQDAQCCSFSKFWVTGHLKASPADLRMLHIRGDSMGPTLYHNYIVLVDTRRTTPSPPGVFVLFDGLGLSAKRIEHVGGKNTVRVISDNPQYSTYERSLDDSFIIGRVVWFGREI